jgi:hypothetical protein
MDRSLDYKLLDYVYRNKVLPEILCGNKFWWDLLSQHCDENITELELMRYFDKILKNISEYELPSAMTRYFESRKSDSGLPIPIMAIDGEDVNGSFSRLDFCSKYFFKCLVYLGFGFFLFFKQA